MAELGACVLKDLNTAKITSVELFTNSYVKELIDL